MRAVFLNSQGKELDKAWSQHKKAESRKAAQQDKDGQHKETEQQGTSAASVHAQANANPDQLQVNWQPEKARLSPAKKEWLLEMIWASDRPPNDYKCYDLNNNDQILEAFEAFVQEEPHSAWEHQCYGF